MTPWARIDVGFLRNPKLISVGIEAKVGHLSVILYAAEWRTDGFIPHRVARQLVRARARRELVAAGLWHPNGDGYLIHGYLDHQPSRADLEAEAERRSQAREQARERQRRHRTSGDP